ncbi:uncharacterized protein EV154DRAFT_431013 [Mucor mucedo]|uniref:uncharacterized protein n=1 Tax=Mucor mucedo TaxID=29922 RepID=UPI002220181D|nr:uncharacterized protein EV154DRAFT_431013 [Mucor mucedo]KAI7873257.1 hypothetical protein EV154DRAFT_431013 [Mucor mucedo]
MYARRTSRRVMSDDEEDENRVTIGTRVGEGHRNYKLMYDMLTGIRTAVGRVSAKIERELCEEDFTAAHKLVFDESGNELTPGVMYDFKFKDYCPWVFRHLRQSFHIDAADYMMSLTNKYILSELGSPGKSGSFFYYSKDYRFIIKTIPKSEHRFMRKILPHYYEHVKNQPHTLLCRYYGLHRIKLPHGPKIRFVVMGNVFPSDKDVHATYDLKGSTQGRRTTAKEIARNPQAVLKDLNWMEAACLLELGPEKKKDFIEQLHRDVELLIKLNIMDYSLLVGVHELNVGNSKHIRDQLVICVRSPRLCIAHSETIERVMKRDSRIEVRKSIKFEGPIQLDASQVLTVGPPGRRKCKFYADRGGFTSTDGGDNETNTLYFLGIIDILTPYNLKKKAEHLVKGLVQDKATISAVRPMKYGIRFAEFIESNVGVINEKQ